MKIQDWIAHAKRQLREKGWSHGIEEGGCGHGADGHVIFPVARPGEPLAAGKVCMYKPGTTELHEGFRSMVRYAFTNAGISASGRTPVPGLNTALTEHVRQIVTDELTAAHRAEIAEIIAEFEKQAKELADRAELAEAEYLSVQSKLDKIETAHAEQLDALTRRAERAEAAAGHNADQLLKGADLIKSKDSQIRLLTTELDAAHAKLEKFMTDVDTVTNASADARQQIAQADKIFRDLAGSLGVKLDDGNLPRIVTQIRLHVRHLQEELESVREGRFRKLPGVTEDGKSAPADKPQLRLVGTPPPVPKNTKKSSNA